MLLSLFSCVVDTRFLQSDFTGAACTGGAWQQFDFFSRQWVWCLLIRYRSIESQCGWEGTFEDHFIPTYLL